MFREKEWKQITLPKRIIAALTTFNTGWFLYDGSYDEKFIKILLLACIGIANVKKNLLNALDVEFIKGELKHLLQYSFVVLIDLFVIKLQIYSTFVLESVRSKIATFTLY